MAVKKQTESAEQIRARIYEALAVNLDLDGVDLRVFLYLSSCLKLDVYTHVPQMRIATMLGRRKEHISRSIRKLIAIEVIVPSDKGVRGSEWRLNPEFGR